MIGAALALLAAAPTATAPITPVELSAPGPRGPLAGTLIEPKPTAPVVLIIPGSGPTDRDGNSPLGVAGAPYRQLAEALAADGIASVRIDKRGLFGSKAAVADPNAATTAGYADDVHAWIDTILARGGGRKCVWVAGHSEGALVALVAAQRPAKICGLILLAGGGRRLSDVIRDQLRANPANAPILDAGLNIIAQLEAGKRVTVADMPAPLAGLFPDALQGYWIDLFSRDPAALIKRVNLPILIVQGERDIQISVADARALKAAQPNADLVLIPGINHLWKPVASDDRTANIATYADTAARIDSRVPAAIAAFLKR